jgi:hypothetical protein
MVVVINPSEGKPSMSKSIRNLSTVTRVGLDLTKNAFQVHAVDATRAIVVARKLTRGRLVPFFAELAPCVVATWTITNMTPLFDAPRARWPSFRIPSAPLSSLAKPPRFPGLRKHP